MALSFASPYYLLLLLPGAALLAVFNGRRRYPPGSRRLILALRGVMIALLVLALAGPHLVVAAPGVSVVYLLDRSHSAQGEDHLTWISRSLQAMAPEDRAAVVAFGRDTRLFKPFAMAGLPGSGADVDPEFTDIQRALETAYSLLPGSGGRIVLISDGLENSGDSLSQAELLARAGIPVDVLPLAAEQGAEVALGNISLPKNTWPGQEVVAEVTVESTVATTAELMVFWGSNLAFRAQVDLAPGSQSFSAPLTVQGQSLQRIRASIEPAVDTEARNNYIDGLTFVQAPPRVLVVEGSAGKGEALAGALAAAGLAVDRLPAGQVDLSPVTLAGYRAVVLADVPAYALKEAEMQTLESYVRVLGGGLVAVGGKTSFGMGLYQDTPLEEALPVSMAVEQKEELPGLDMVLVIDKSGSMSGEKLNMAKNAALRSLDVLKERDRLGVITFDDSFYIETPLTSLADIEKIAQAIEGIGEGGGTVIYPALEEAVKMLEGSTKAKHIILLSDGQEGAQFSYQGLLERARAAGISISTIALGDGADAQRMQYLAEMGNGRYYEVREGQDLPQVFLQETVLAGGDWLVEEPFVPTLLHPAALAMAGNTPGFGGYIASTAKPLAEVLMSTHRDHPLMARWQYGLGRAVAFTSDTYGMWSREFLAHPGFASLWLDTLNWAAPSGQGGDIALESRLEGAGVEISALTSSLEEGESLAVTLVDAQGSEVVLELLPAGGGMYTAHLDQIGQGVYLLSATRTRDGAVVSQALGGFAVPYPPEFRIQRYSGRGLLEQIAAAGGGRILSQPQEVFSAQTPPPRKLTDITWWLVLAAIIIWPVDIALRRMGGLPTRKKRPGKAKVVKREEAEPDETMERLLSAKRRKR